jgi:tetratricopeptide (TPR) repeat protein
LTSPAAGFNLRQQFAMKTPATLSRFGAVCAAMLFLVAGAGTALPQTTNGQSASTPEELSQAELLKSYIHLQEQLHSAQLAIERNRVEYQEAARAQAAAITEKLNSIHAALDAERQRQQDEMQRSNRTLLWVASAFGGVGLMAMLFTVLFLWRTMGRMAEVSAMRGQLAAPASQGLLPADTGGLPGKTVEISNQRLLAVIDRLEHRVFDLESTAARPLPPPTQPTVPDSATPPAAGPGGNAARITVLLGKGQSLLNVDKAQEAMACYDEILALDENHPEALVKKGAALERLKQDDEALRCYDRAIAADRTMTIAYLYKGGVYNRLERYNEALECYEQALRAQGGAT